MSNIFDKIRRLEESMPSNNALRWTATKIGGYRAWYKPENLQFFVSPSSRNDGTWHVTMQYGENGNDHLWDCLPSADEGKRRVENAVSSGACGK